MGERLLKLLMIHMIMLCLGASETFNHSSMIQRGVIDRISYQNKAVILLEDINEECLVCVENLPQGSSEQSWVTVLFLKYPLKCIVLHIDEERTRTERDRSKQLHQQLREKSINR